MLYLALIAIKSRVRFRDHAMSAWYLVKRCIATENALPTVCVVSCHIVRASGLPRIAIAQRHNTLTTVQLMQDGEHHPRGVQFV